MSTTTNTTISAQAVADLREKTGAGLLDCKKALVEAGKRTFLLYDNYEALLGYNCAHSYALSVGLLADRLR